MRVACLSDIHGNIRGLNACLTDLAEQGGADRILGLGDYCLDGPRPREVLERLAECGATCLRGNTDRYISERADRYGGERLDRAGGEDPGVLAWQRERLGDRWVRWLCALPPSLRVGEGPDALLGVHANPKGDDVHIWPDASDSFLESIFAGVEERTLAFGHLHLPYVRMWRDRMLVNVASAGLPKDGDPRAGYAILTQRPGGWQVRHRRVEFDVEKVVRDIEQAKMPEAKRAIKILRRHRYKDLDEHVI